MANIALRAGSVPTLKKIRKSLSCVFCYRAAAPFERAQEAARTLLVSAIEKVAGSAVFRAGVFATGEVSSNHER
jgi:hypothetical protein